MGLFDFFRKRKGEDPVERYEDDVLGPMVWSEDDEAWTGEYGGVKYLIAYGQQARPTDELLEYAREVLSDLSTFLGSVQLAKQSAAAKSPWLAGEIAGLQVEILYFYTHKGAKRILADLAGGDERYRSWRAEFKGTDCEGIGFDT